MARKRFDSSRIELVRPSLWRWPARLGLALWASWLALLFFHLEAGALSDVVVAWSGMAATVVGLASLRHIRKDRRRRLGRLVADEKGLHFRNRTIVDREHIFAAHLLGGRRPQVQILRHTSPAPVEIRVASEEAGLQLVRGLGLTIAEGTAQVHLLYRWAHTQGCVVIAALALGGVVLLGAAATPWALAALPLPVMIPIAVMRQRKRAIIGSDGLLLETLFRRRFIEYRNIARVDRFDRRILADTAWSGVDIRLRSDEQLRLLTAYRGAAQSAADTPEPISVALAERLQDLVDTVRDAGRLEAEAKQIVRDGRNDGEWFDHLRRLGSGSAADYRSAPVHADDLWRLVDNPGAEPSARVGAAVALASADADGAPRRLRAVAASVVAPLPRRALERVAGAKSEKGLRRALAGIEDEDEPHRAAQ